ncbi:hypothetical protein [Candidatus Thiodictyon syntrophicum]|uniref:hypothetical protein n=1 Tax=Candidatus Thiodictyon syntrophicum TaxID=1166950 RepID=UPI0012FE1722|nr:hypothetical protein [Candidatus Thiodictyon syntrophicum]
MKLVSPLLRLLASPYCPAVARSDRSEEEMMNQGARIVVAFSAIACVLTFWSFFGASPSSANIPQECSISKSYGAFRGAFMGGVIIMIFEGDDGIIRWVNYDCNVERIFRRY